MKKFYYQIKSKCVPLHFTPQMMKWLVFLFHYSVRYYDDGDAETQQIQSDLLLVVSLFLPK